MGELDHGSLSVVGKKFLLQSTLTILTSDDRQFLPGFALIFHPRELVLDLISKNDPLHLLFIERIMTFRWMISMLRPHSVGAKLSPFGRVNYRSSGVLGTHFYRSGYLKLLGRYNKQERDNQP